MKRMKMSEKDQGTGSALTRSECGAALCSRVRAERTVLAAPAWKASLCSTPGREGSCCRRRTAVGLQFVKN